MNKSTTIQSLKHPIKALLNKSATENIAEKSISKIEDVNLGRRAFFPKILGGIVALTLLNKCGYDISGPASDNFTAYQPNNDPLIKLDVGSTLIVQDLISTVPLSIKISSISKPDLSSDPREVTLQILNADNTVAWSTSRRAGETTLQFYNPADASSSVLYEIEVKEIPGTPYPDPDWARLTVWEKSIKPA